MKPKYTYRIEADILDRGWLTLVGEQDGSLEYMRGRFAGFKEGGSPRPAFRLVRIDPNNPAAPKVLEEVGERKTLSVGMIPQACGFQWSAYAHAAANALRVASADVRHASRRNDLYQGHSERFAEIADEVDALCRLVQP